MSEMTTIQLQKNTREALKGIGRKGESYDVLIQRLIETAQKSKFFAEIDRILDTEEFVSLDEI